MNPSDRASPVARDDTPAARIRAWMARQHPLAFVGVAVLAAILLWMSAGVAIQSWRSSGNKPWETDSCALGRVDNARFRELMKSLRERQGFLGASCAADLMGHRTCFGRLTLTRAAELQDRFGGGMEGRLLALHGLMRAGKAVLLSQTSIPTPKPITFEGLLSPEAADFFRRNQRPPPVPRAELLVYALDAREFDLPGPVWRSRRGFSGSWQPGSGPTGDRAIARLAVTLSDPALDPDDDRDNGSVMEEAAYMDAAWSDVTGDRERRYPASEGPGNIHKTASLCPRRPAWLDIVVEPRPRGSAAAGRRRLFQGLDEKGETRTPDTTTPARP